jgi:hypothetical protein
MWLVGRVPCSIEVQLVSKLSGNFIRSQKIYSICPSPMIQEETHYMCVRNVTIPVLIQYIFSLWLEGRLPFSIEVQLVNPSGKASAQIPQLPLGDNSSPWGDNATCTGAHTGYTAGSAKSLSATYQYKISNTRNKLLANKNLTNN